MATDYDAPRKSEDDSESIEALKERVPDKLSGTTGDEDSDNPSNFDLPGADLSDLELDVVVLPAQQDEFTCMSCFLVKHRSQLDHEARSALPEQPSARRLTRPRPSGQGRAVVSPGAVSPAPRGWPRRADRASWSRSSTR